MKYVRVTFLSTLVNDGSYYAHLGETRGRLRQFLLEMDTIAGMWLKRHMDRGGNSGKFPNGVRCVQIRQGKSSELYGKLYFALRNAVEPTILKTGWAIIAAYNNKCGVLIEDQLLEEVKLKEDELYLVFPERSVQSGVSAHDRRTIGEVLTAMKMQRLRNELSQLNYADRQPYLQNVSLKDLAHLRDVYVEMELFEEAAEIRDTIENRN